MSRILFTSMPFAGHLRPGLPIAQALVEAGHDVAWYSGAQYAHLVRRIGVRVFPMSPERDQEDTSIERGRDGKKPGLGTLKRDILDVFIHPIPGWVEEIEAVLDEFRPDVIVAENGFMAGPIAGERRGIPSVVFNVSPLGLSSDDTAPFGMGLLPASSAAGRVRNRALNWAIRKVLFAECQRAAEQVRARLGLPPLTSYFMDWGAEIADRYLCPSVPAFEYPRSDLPTNVEFVGPFLSAGVDDWTPPVWWDDILAARAAGRPVVLVTQGTIAIDPANLVLPAIEALRDGAALVIATTSGHDPDDVLPAEDRPANVRLTEFVPFTELLPLVDVLVTNGGYGGVQLALANGVPLVVAGTTEDKMEVCARVTWSGTGVAMKVDRPSPEQVRAGVATVLGDPRFRTRAQEIGAAYAGYRGAARAAEAILEVAAVPAPTRA